MEGLSKIILITFLVTFLQFAFFRTSDEQPPYVPTDNITLNCGVLYDSQASDGRCWSGDKSSLSEAYEADNQDAVDRVPYMTARVSSSEFKYTFPVSPGQKFVRLYFYPVSYETFHRDKAFFSVKSGPFSLLHNFSASLVADSLNVKSFVREFCLNVEENQVLDLIFTPTPSASNDTYAFINGIEIVSMPTNLYYPRLDDQGLPFVGQHAELQIDNNTALENVRRLNIGGRSISPVGDTGMYRNWYNDFGFLVTPGVVPTNTSIRLNYSKIRKYTAPDEVYRTAMSMGSNRTKNLLYNLTWRVPVDSGFRYLVRLHFCEFDPQLERVSDRKFRIYIDNKTAEAAFDVIEAAGGNGIPTYHDYVVMIGNAADKGEYSLFIALYPRNLYSAFADVILNGLEIFKLNKSDGNLAGPNPMPQPPPAGDEQPSPRAEKSNSNRKLLFLIGGGGIGLLIVLVLLCYIIVWRHRKRQHYGSYSGKSWFCWWISPNKEKSTKSSFLPEELCRHFSLDEIRAATNNFHDDLVVGKGGFGKVYKGFLDEGKTIVAIKRLNPESGQGVKEFLTEIEMLSQLRHVHLVSLIGYCKENGEMILVYDFMSNGTLSDHLYGTNYDPLPWKQRLEICRGAAMGLNYLHTEVKDTVIHRDVKTSNILLDDKFTAKVSDFGLSKTDPKVEMLNTGVKGTRGYLDPEYARGHGLTEKSDVYSFGVVLFEVLCARKALDNKLPAAQMNLAHWARQCIANGTLYQVIDPYLTGKIAEECFKVFVKIAENCIADGGVNRPSMNDVMERLRFAIELQEAADREEEKKNPGCTHSYPDITLPVARDIDFDDEQEVDSELDTDSSIGSGIGGLDSNATGMTYPNIESSTSSGENGDSQKA